MHVHVVQPALPAYRVDFFERVARMLDSDLTVHHPADQTTHAFGAMAVEPTRFGWQRVLGRYRRLPLGLAWHDGALSMKVHRDDLLVIPGAPRCLSYMSLLLIARVRGARVIWWGHYWTASSRPWRFALRLMLMRLSAGILLYTDHEVEALRARLGHMPARPVSALNNGIDTDPVRVDRTRYRAGERGRALLFIGRLTAKARLADLLEALAEPELADARLEVVGSGPEEDALRRKAGTLGIAGRIAWHGTLVEEETIAPIANRCALFVYPGAVGLSLIHAMAYGLPAVVHGDRRRHMPEIGAFADGVTGRAFRARDPGSLARTLARALADPAARERWSQACLERTAESYNTRSMARRFCALVEAVRRGDGGSGAGRC